MHHSSHDLQFYLSSAAKYLTVGVAISLSSPIEFVRIRMQTMPELINSGKLTRPYSNIFDCCNRVVHQEGRRTFWKGNCSTLVKFYPSEGLNWTFKSLYQRLFKTVIQRDSTAQEFATNYVGGALGGLTSRALLYPLQYTRNKMSVIGNSKIGILDCLKQTMQKQGLRGIYKGALVSFVGVAIFRSTYFGIYDTFKDRTTNATERWAVSYLGTLTAISLTYPSDTIRRRMMLSSSKDQQHKGFISSCMNVWRKEGLRGLYSGGPIIFLQAATVASIYFIIDRIIGDIRN